MFYFDTPLFPRPLCFSERAHLRCGEWLETGGGCVLKACKVCFGEGRIGVQKEVDEDLWNQLLSCGQRDLGKRKRENKRFPPS